MSYIKLETEINFQYGCNFCFGKVRQKSYGANFLESMSLACISRLASLTCGCFGICGCPTGCVSRLGCCSSCGSSSPPGCPLASLSCGVCLLDLNYKKNNC